MNLVYSIFLFAALILQTQCTTLSTVGKLLSIGSPSKTQDFSKVPGVGVVPVTVHNWPFSHLSIGVLSTP